MLEMHGSSRLLFSFNDAIPGFIFSGLFFTDKYLKEKPENVRAFLRGLINAFDYIKKNEKKARQLIPKYCGVGLDVAMKSALRQLGDGREPVDQIYKQQKLMIQNGRLPKKVSLERFVDYSFLPR